MERQFESTLQCSKQPPTSPPEAGHKQKTNINCTVSIVVCTQLGAFYSNDMKLSALNTKQADDTKLPHNAIFRAKNMLATLLADDIGHPYCRSKYSTLVPSKT